MTDADERAPEPQLEGYLVVLRPDAHAVFLHEHVAAHMPDPPAYRAWVAALRHALGGLEPARYAGVCRQPIDRWLAPLTEEHLAEIRRKEKENAADPEAWARMIRASLTEEELLAAGEQVLLPPKPGWLEEVMRAPGSPDPDEPAKRLMYERLGPDPGLRWQVDYVNSCLVPDLAFARELLALTGRPEDREVVRVERATEVVTSSTLGFDVGQWGGTPFSVHLDTMLAPQWHPAPEEEVPALSAFARQLNKHLLFPTAAEAQAFHDWYVAHDWAEIGTFPVIRVEAVPSG
jgi:hypothetical protein